MKITVDINYRFTNISTALLDTILAYNLMTETSNCTEEEVIRFKEYLTKLITVTDNFLDTK